MKQTKWQRLATIGLCSSLVINAFSGVTAVAETITIESSPTVASSAKEATSASSATPESTESSQETTETSREEVTQETEKPEVVEKISDDKEKTVISDYLNKGAKTIPEINKISPKATYNFPKVNYQFGFVDEAGNLMNPAPFSILFDYARGDRTTVPVKWTVISANEKATDSADNLKNMVVPAVSLAQPAGGAIYSVPSNFRLTIPKYYSSISIYNSDGKINPKYPVPIVKQYDSGVINNWIDEFHALNLTKDEAGYYKMYDTSVDGHGYPLLMQRYVTPPGKISHNVYTYFSGPVYYHLINRKVTENFVDDNGTKITPPTGFTQGNKIPMTSNTFKYTAAKALPATYTAGGKTYTFQGWYKGKTKPNTLTTSTTPTYNTTFDGNDDMTAMYKEEVPKASVALTRTTAETVTSGGNVTWRATITNTSQAPLTTATIKKSTAWTTGLAAPTAMIVTPAGGTAKTVPVTATTWTNGVSLGTDIPVGKSATVQFTTKATGTAGQVLRAGITTSGNYSGVSASATVRVKDNDQVIVTPTAEGFISVPTFNFGQVGVAGSTQQHSLKKAADYYGNGTRNPYLRIKKTQPNWSLTAQLSQPKSATDSLPTTTRLLLGTAAAASFTDYNQPTETKTPLGKTGTVNLTADNTATAVVANQQFTGSDVYQLDFTFANIKLEVPANQGMSGQQYQAAVTWNLVTGP